MQNTRLKLVLSRECNTRPGFRGALLQDWYSSQICLPVWCSEVDMASTNALILSYVSFTCTLASACADLDLGFVQWPHLLVVNGDQIWKGNYFDAANDANPGSPGCAPYVPLVRLENLLLAISPASPCCHVIDVKTCVARSCCQPIWQECKVKCSRSEKTCLCELIPQHLRPHMRKTKSAATCIVHHVAEIGANHAILKVPSRMYSSCTSCAVWWMSNKPG